MIEKLLIVRQEWLRGEGFQSSYLLRVTDQKMCCLGFYLAACGVQRSDLAGVEGPSALNVRQGSIPNKAKWLFDSSADAAALCHNHSKHCDDLMYINDDKVISDEEREQRIREIFAQHGIAVEFVDVTGDL